MNRINYGLGIVLAFISCMAAAQTYKCTIEGRVTYADAPCAHNARRADALQDHMTDDQQIQRLRQSIKERQTRNAIEQQESAEYSQRQRALESQIASEAAQARADEAGRKQKCTSLEHEIKWNERDIARYQAFGWQQPLTQREGELRKNKDAYDKNCR